MATIQNERDEYLDHLANRLDEVQGAFDDMMLKATRDNQMETLARVERAKKSVAAKGEDLDVLMEEGREAGERQWEELRPRLDAVWREYREAVERARLELERAEEL